MRGLRRIAWVWLTCIGSFATGAAAQSIVWSHVSAADERLACPIFHSPSGISAVDAGGNLVLVGCSGGVGDGADILIRKIRSDGSIAWSALREPPEFGSVSAVRMSMDANGNPVVAGWIRSSGLGSTFLTTKYDGATGAKLWESIAPDYSPYTFASAVATDSAGDVFVAGPDMAETTLANDILLIKYSRDLGQEIWRARYAAIDGFAEVRGIVIDANGDALISGYIGLADGENIITAKFGGANGQQQWARAFRGDAAGNNRSTGIALDQSGNAVVTGWTTDLVGGRNIVTIKYSGIDGSTMWDARFDGASSGSDDSSGLMVGDDGDVTVVGMSNSMDGGENFLTLRYRADGTSRWTRGFSASNSSYERIQALALDAYGNAYVTGGALGSSGSQDYSIIGYAALTGDELWRLQFDFGDFLHDESGALRISPDGSLWVAGNAQTPAGIGIGVLKLGIPAFADGFEEDDAP